MRKYLRIDLRKSIHGAGADADVVHFPFASCHLSIKKNIKQRKRVIKATSDERGANVMPKCAFNGFGPSICWWS